MKYLKILIFGIILGIFLGGFAFAQEIPELIQDEEVKAEDLGISEAKVLPDNPFYFLKDWARNLRLFFAFNREKKFELKLRIANEKLIEARKLAELKKDPRLLEKNLAEFQKEMENIAKEDREVLKKFSDKILHQQLLHQRILQRLENQVSAEIMEKIRERRMAHLEKFAQVMQKVEERARIAERIGEELEKIKGSKFRDFKNLEILEEIKEKMPEDVKQKIEEKRAQITERLRERLEGMSSEEKENFKNYLEKIAGNKLKHLEIMSDLEANEISEELREKIEKVKEKKIEEISKEKGISATSVYAWIQKAEEEIKKAEEKIATTSENEYGGKAARRLLEIAKKHLERAKEAFDEGKYGRAFGLAVASYHEALNVQRIVEKVEKIKQSPQTLREKFEKLYPGVELPENIQKCPLPAKPECGEGEVWRIGKDEKGCLVFVCEKVREREGKPEVCLQIWDPVCGKDGKTYSNECFAKMAGVEVSHKGECKGKECKTDADCGVVQKCGMSWECVEGKCVQVSKECPRP